MINTDYTDKKIRLDRFIFCVLGAWCLVLCACGCSAKPYHAQTRLIMGTVVEITAQDKKAIDAAFTEIERIDALMSNYRPNSEISQLNANGQAKVSHDTLYVIKMAKYFHKLSGGAFDITVGPLVKLWNIKENMQKEARQIKIPSQERINSALSYVSSNFIEIDEKNSIIRLRKKGVSLDLGAIAKGYAVDRAVAILKHYGVKSALVNAGGQIYCLGRKGFLPWGVGLQDPRKPGGLLGTFKLTNRAVSTSGDYEQYFIYNNKHYTHIIDPRNGYPADNSICSVSVFADGGLTADALSTVIFVLGEEKGRKLAAKFKHVEVRIITR